MTAPADAREKLARIIATNRLSCYADDEIWSEDLADYYDRLKRLPALKYANGIGEAFRDADAILAAYPQLAAPTQSAVEEARDIAALHLDAHPLSDAVASLTKDIATAITAAEARVRKELADLLKSIEFSQNGYCPVCGGWMVSPNGCTPKAHTEDCTLAAAIRAGGGR